MDSTDSARPTPSSPDAGSGSGSGSGSGRGNSTAVASEPWSFARLPPSNSNQSSQDRHDSLPRSIFGASSVLPLRSQQYDADSRVGPHLLPTVVKDVDDVTSPPSSASRARHGRAESSTLSTLSRLFATTSPDLSRSGSWATPPRYPSPYTRSLYGDRAAALPDHLYSRGLLSGKHSDITVHAFGHEYKLHRLILDRAPFFASALSEPWLESNAKSMTVCPEDIDPSISQTAFELALKRLYGCSNLAEEEQDPVGLFCVG